MTNLSSLPTGFSVHGGATSFSCSSVTSGTGCVLTLDYAATTAATGTLTINYSYTNNQSSAKTGTATATYTATAPTGPAANTVSGSSQPSSPVAVLTGATTPVVVTFTTSDGATATNFSVTSGLSSLPTDWTAAPTTLTCATVSTGSSCSVTLTFHPLSVTSGTIALAYAYTDHAGTAKTGTTNIVYSTTSNNNVNAVRAPGGTVYVPANGTPATVQVTFNTDDVNAATNLSATTTGLPAGWTGPASPFTCSTVAQTGTACRLSLTFTPTTAVSGTVTIPYTYTANDGTAKGPINITIPYTSVTPHAFVANGTGGVIVCDISATTGAISNCASALALSGVNGLAFDSAGNGYIGQPASNVVRVCDVDGSTGVFSNCTNSGLTFTTTQSLEVSGTGFWSVEGFTSGRVDGCDVDVSTGSISGCAQTSIGGSARLYGMYFGTDFAYFTDNSASKIDLCDLSSNGILSGCVQTGADIQQPIDVKVSGSFAYITDNGTSGVPGQAVTVCAIQSDQTLSACTDFATNVSRPRYIAIYNGFAYVSGGGGSIDICPVNATTGGLGACTNDTGGGLFAQTQQLKIQ